MSEKVPKPTDMDIVLGRDDLDRIGKARDAAPTVHELAERFGTEVREEVNPSTGRREVVATGPLKAVAEALTPSWRIEDQARQEMESRMKHETLVGPDGKQERRWVGVSEGAARSRGLKPVWKAGGARLVTGPNGNLWRLEGGKYVDTGKKCLTRPWIGDDDDTPPMGSVVIH